MKLNEHYKRLLFISH